ncbi:hypothetical protein KL938_000179 [Ogataea parapolymorpha]|nr:hypothetical protein KL938_000179 [Ogataea parapolymorpha]
MAEIQRANAGGNLKICQGYAIGSNRVLLKVANNNIGECMAEEETTAVHDLLQCLKEIDMVTVWLEEELNPATFRVHTGVKLFVPGNLVCIT